MIAILIIASFVLFGLWGVTGNTLFDRRMRMNSWLGVINALLGVGAVACISILGAYTFLQATWEVHYMPMDKNLSRWAPFVAFINLIVWAGPQLTGTVLLTFAWWLWSRCMRDHLYYVIDTRWRNKSAE